MSSREDKHVLCHAFPHSCNLGCCGRTEVCKYQELRENFKHVRFEWPGFVLRPVEESDLVSGSHLMAVTVYTACYKIKNFDVSRSEFCVAYDFRDERR